MSKLSAKHARALALTVPALTDADKAAITQTFPASVASEAIDAYAEAALTAIEHYRAYLPLGTPVRRKHRAAAETPEYPASAHRPADALRHGLVGQLYDAYMTARGDDPSLRGFKRSADAVLTAAGLPSITEHEQQRVRDQIKQAAALIAAG